MKTTNQLLQICRGLPRRRALQILRGLPRQRALQIHRPLLPEPVEIDEVKLERPKTSPELEAYKRSDYPGKKRKVTEIKAEVRTIKLYRILTADSFFERGRLI